MALKIPFVSTSDHSKPVSRVIRSVADKMGFSEGTAALTLSHFCEEIAKEVAMGNAVTIPAFGMFAPVRWEPRVGHEAPAIATPRFYPSQCFKNEVSLSCDPWPKAERYYNNYRKNHTNYKNKKVTRKTVHTGQKAFRDRVEAQCRRMHVDPHETGS